MTFGQRFHLSVVYFILLFSRIASIFLVISAYNGIVFCISILAMHCSMLFTVYRTIQTHVTQNISTVALLMSTVLTIFTYVPPSKSALRFRSYHMLIGLEMIAMAVFGYFQFHYTDGVVMLGHKMTALYIIIINICILVIFAAGVILGTLLQKSRKTMQKEDVINSINKINKELATSNKATLNVINEFQFLNQSPDLYYLDDKLD